MTLVERYGSAFRFPSRSASRSVSRALAACGLAALAACSTLPTVSPETLPAATPRLETASGRVLSPARSREILARLQRGGAPTSIFDRHLALEEAVSESPLRLGNSVVLLENGPATYDAMFAAIAQARDHVNMETYILDDDAIGRRFADALIAKQREGVQVNLLHDGVGTLSTPKAYFDRLVEAGVRVVEFNPVNPLNAKAGWDLNQRDHRKLLVVDGTTAILGGINISGVYSSGSSGGSSGRSSGSAAATNADAPDAKARPWRDTDVQIQGPVVADLQKLFVETWERQKGPPLAPRTYYPAVAARGPEVVRAIGSDPTDPFSLIYVTFISAINSAETEICMTNAYFVPDPQLVASLVGAAARGVDVKIVVPSATDSSLVFHAGRSHYEALLRGGVKLYERRRVLLHAKTAVIDGVWATVGSANLDWRSFLHNQELNAVVLGADFGARMRAAFEKDVAESDPITLERWRRRPMSARVKEGVARLWQYWL